MPHARIDGGIHTRRPPANPQRSPANEAQPPAPRRTGMAGPAQGSPMAVERRAQNHQRLNEAATRTHERVAAAATTNRALEGLRQSSVGQNRAFRAELDMAQADAYSAQRAANSAVHEELAVARSVLPPARHAEYADALLHDFASSPAQAAVAQTAVQHALSTARIGSPDRLEQPAATQTPAEALSAQIENAQRAQAAADRAAERLAAHPDSSIQQYQFAATRAEAAEEAWLKVETTINASYAELDGTSTPPKAQDIESLSARLLATAPSDARVEQIVLQAQADSSHRAAQALIDSLSPPPPERPEAPFAPGESNQSLPPLLSGWLAPAGTVQPLTAAQATQLSDLVALETSSLAALGHNPTATLQALQAEPAQLPRYRVPVQGLAFGQVLRFDQLSVQEAIDRGRAQATEHMHAANPTAWAAYEQGGASAAAADIRAQVDAARSAPERERILAQSSVLLRQIDFVLQTNSGSADVRDDANGLRPHFDATVSDLSAIATAVAGTPAGDSFIRARADAMARSITHNNDVGRFDEALGLAIENGQGAALTVAVIDRLSASGNIQSVERAGDILENASRAISTLTGRVQDTQKAADRANGELAAAMPYLTLLPQNQRETAVNSFYDDHADIYAARDDALTRLLSDAGLMNGLVQERGRQLSAGTTDRGQEAVDRTKQATEQLMTDAHVIRAARESDAVSSVVVAGVEAGRTSLFSPAGLQALAAAEGADPAVVNAWQDIVFNSVGATSAARREANDSAGADQLLARLEDYAVLAGETPQAQASYRQAVGHLRNIVLETRPDGALQQAQELGDLLDSAAWVAADPAMAERFQRVGLAVSVASVGARAPEVLRSGDLADRLGLAVDAGSAALSAFELRQVGSESALLRARAFGKLLGGVELALSLNSFPSNGDDVEKGLAAAAIIGQIGLLVSVPGAGWVAGIGGVGLLIYQALDKTQDNPVARDLLIAGGLDPEVAQALTQYDKNGYPGAFAIRAGVAEHLELRGDAAQSASGQQAIFEFLAALSPQQARALAEVAQEVKPEAADSGNVRGESDEAKADRLARRDPDGDGIHLPQGVANDKYFYTSFLGDTLRYHEHAELPSPGNVMQLAAWFGAYESKHPDNAWPVAL